MRIILRLVVRVPGMQAKAEPSVKHMVSTQSMKPAGAAAVALLLP